MKTLYEAVERETEQARDRFLPAPVHLDRDLPARSLWISVIAEEVGKLARSCNKLEIATDAETRETWYLEGEHRIVTCMSLLRRMYEKWRDWPDVEQYIKLEGEKDE